MIFHHMIVHIHVCDMTFRPGNDSEWSRTNFRAGRILIPHRIPMNLISACISACLLLRSLRLIVIIGPLREGSRRDMGL